MADKTPLGMEFANWMALPKAGGDGNPLAILLAMATGNPAMAAQDAAMSTAKSAFRGSEIPLMGAAVPNYTPPDMFSPGVPTNMRFEPAAPPVAQQGLPSLGQAIPLPGSIQAPAGSMQFTNPLQAINNTLQNNPLNDLLNQATDFWGIKKGP